LFNLFLFFAGYQFLLHIYFTLASNDPRLFMPTAVAFLHDLAILGIVATIFYYLQYLFPDRLKSSINRFASIALIVIGISFSSYPKILREYLAFPVNLFNSDFDSAKVLISEYLGISALAPSLLALVLGVIVLLSGLELKVSRKIKTIVLLIIFVLFTATLQKASPQPFVFSIQKELESLVGNKERNVPSLTRTISKAENADEIKLLSYSSKEISNYSHILFIVLEGVTSAAFESDFLKIQDGFYSLYQNNTVYYNNYYASNLDSYTSLIAMLTSIQVPYRAYANENLYIKVNKAPSITQDLHKMGFYNTFISTYEHQPFVPTRNHWNKIYDRRDIKSLDGWLSLGSNKMEAATEDKAAISTIIDELKSNKKTFILHEMVYGHSPEWRANTGKSQSVYYNEYLVELANELEENNFLDKALLIIVSDHGNRAKPADIDNYRVPLLVMGRKIRTQVRDDLLTHTELPKIIYHYSASDKHPMSRDEIYFVGSTEKLVYGKMTKDRKYLFIDNSPGIIMTKTDGMNAVEVKNEFQTYFDRFNQKYGK